MKITVTHETRWSKGPGRGYPVKPYTPGSRSNEWTNVFVNGKDAGRVPGTHVATSAIVREWAYTHACDMAAFAAYEAQNPATDQRRRIGLLLGKEGS